jgi:ubiquinone/menaquinone biosynthesis C-methylase UbiE
MDILTALDPKADYTMPQLQLIISAWVMTTLLNGKEAVSMDNGRVEEDDYTKQSIYSLFYSLYRSVGVVESDNGEVYECTFNAWGYDWSDSWGMAPTGVDDPQRFGKNAYTGLFNFDQVKDYVAKRDGAVHVVEMGCGTGAGAHLVCRNVLPNCTYEAVDMQRAGVETCRRKFVPRLGGRLQATRADCTKMPMQDGVADIVAICETHVTEHGGMATDEDQRFFREALRILKPGGMLVWGNAIPEATWKPCFDFLDSIGMQRVETRDVSQKAIDARDKDRGRVDAYVEQAIRKFPAFRIPVIGPKKRAEAEIAMKNFYRNPGTNLYDDMVTGIDSYRVTALQKRA